MPPIKVLQVVTVMNRGGLETMVMNYYRKIDKEKIQFDFIVHREERGDYDDEIESLGGNIYRMPAIKPGNYRKYFKALDNFFKEHNEYTTVHSHINENSGFVLKYAKKYGIQNRIAHSHIADLKLDYKYPFRMYARMYLKPNTNKFFACSEKAGEWLFGKEGISNDQITILNNAVDTNLFKYNVNIRNKVRNDLNIEDKFVIGHVGRFNPQKNHKYLIDIFSEIYKLNNNAVLLLIGTGYMMDEIKLKVSELGLNDSVKFLGLREDIHNMMQAMDIFLFPSLFEGLPVVLIEAQAAGLKCVTSTGVTKESDITNSIEFIDLNVSAKEWANKILSLDVTRKDFSHILISKGYDSTNNVNLLNNFYLLSQA